MSRDRLTLFLFVAKLIYDYLCPLYILLLYLVMILAPSKYLFKRYLHTYFLFLFFPYLLFSLTVFHFSIFPLLLFLSLLLAYLFFLSPFLSLIFIMYHMPLLCYWAYSSMFSVDYFYITLRTKFSVYLLLVDFCNKKEIFFLNLKLRKRCPFKDLSF